MHKSRRLALLVLFSAGCAGMMRDCSGCTASNFGADWVVITSGMNGEILNCWALKDTAMENEHGTDGIWWKDGQTGHLVHLSGWYSRVQVVDGQFRTAAEHLAVDLDRCPGGRYLPETHLSEATIDGHAIAARTAANGRVTSLKLDGKEISPTNPLGLATLRALADAQKNDAATQGAHQ